MRDSTDSYRLELTECDGSNVEILAAAECSISLDTLTLAPFSLVLGDSIDAIIVAKNIYGDSDTSVVGSGANIVLVPDAPLTLENEPLTTTAT